MTGISLARRFSLALGALLLAFLALRPIVSSALVARGDHLWAGGDVSGALRAYGRAWRLESHSAVAAERLSFMHLLRHSRADDVAAFTVADEAIARDGIAADLLVDRALARARLGDDRRAAADFARAARLRDDPRYRRLAIVLDRRASRPGPP